MKKLRKIRNRLLAIINLLMADEYFVFTYENTTGHKYDMEYRSSSPLPMELATVINNDLFTVVAAAHEQKQIQANCQKLNNILNK